MVKIKDFIDLRSAVRCVKRICISEVQNMAIKPLVINSKTIRLMKPVTGADYEGKTVLTNSAWEYVELWLKRQNNAKAKAFLDGLQYGAELMLELGKEAAQ